MNNLKDLKFFQELLYKNFKDYKNYGEMKPVSNQLAKLYGTSKIHKFDYLKDTTKP